MPSARMKRARRAWNSSKPGIASFGSSEVFGPAYITPARELQRRPDLVSTTYSMGPPLMPPKLKFSVGIPSSRAGFILSRIEREHIKPAREDGIPTENFNFGGISGGPMLYVVETKSGLRCNSLAGVIYAGPNTSDDPNEAIPGFELFHARRARFIRADGILDHGLWESVQI